jgi:subtilase family serine protease
LEALANHHPQWASKANDAGPLSADEPLEQLTLVLARSAEQGAALKTMLAEQQTPGSPRYHHWLKPDEMGERFGLSQRDIDTLTGWLQSQGLHVNWVSPSRSFLAFGGTAGAVGHAFHTELHTYRTTTVDGKAVDRMSIASDPLIPLALHPAIRAITGLYTVEDRPFHRSRALESIAPRLTLANGEHVIAPNDFNVIYDNRGQPSSVTIGIVGEARTNFSDFDNFRQQTQTSFPNPTEIVPTAYGGVDPGPALAVFPCQAVRPSRPPARSPSPAAATVRLPR